MQSWNEVRAQQERHVDALRFAEKDRLVLHELALRERAEKTARLHCRVMTCLGRALVSWGWRLQQHFGATEQVGATAEVGATS
ncbi:MAG TPA: hypothetical protein VM075_01005 [Anaerolineae bacterium]|nr:hypothetical protein [Anaerolineae bacterium]